LAQACEGGVLCCRAMPRPQSSGRACRRSSSVPVGPRQTSCVGALLHHDPPAARRNHARDNVLAMRAKAKQVRAQLEEAAAQEKPPFKLQQFDNVPSRLHSEPRRSVSATSRPSSAPARRSDNENHTPNVSLQSPASSPGWRVSSGYGSLSSPEKALLEPFAWEPLTPPRATVKATQQLEFSPPNRARGFSTPVKSPSKALAQESPAPADKFGDEGEFDVGSFERIAKQQKQQRGKHIRAKDAQGSPTHLQHNRTAPMGPLSHCGEAVRPSVPVGYRVLSDSERVGNLGMLQRKFAELNIEYNKLGEVFIETEGEKKRQHILISRIEEMRKAIAEFSRPTVHVRI